MLHNPSGRIPEKLFEEACLKEKLNKIFEKNSKYNVKLRKTNNFSKFTRLPISDGTCPDKELSANHLNFLKKLSTLKKRRK